MSTEGWKTEKLGELLVIQNGYAFSSDFFDKARGMPLVRIRDLKGGHSTAIRYTGEYDENYIVKCGDLLVGMDGEFRCYEWCGPDALLNQRVCRLKDFGADIDRQFVRYGINIHLKKIEDETSFATVKHLSAKKIKEIEFAFPPIPEQRRIISRIKECVGRVDEIEALRVETISEARATLPSMLNRVFDELASKYDQVCIGDVSIESRYGTSRKCSTEPLGTPILRIPNVRDGFVNSENLKYCDLDEKELERLQLQPGDLLFVRTNGSRDLVGRCAVFEQSNAKEKFAYASYLIRLRLDRDKALPNYVSFFLSSSHGRAELDKRRRTSAGQFNINSKNLRSIELPIPPIDVQRELLKELQLMQAQVLQLRSEINSAQQDESQLFGSILSKAFSGEL